MIKYAEIGGLKIEYWTKGEGQPLLFLHGSFGSFRFYLPILEMLAKDYKVIAPTFPGMGKSQSPRGGIDFETYANTALYFIKEIIKDRRFILVGHSLGASLAISLNQKFKLNNSQLVLINPGSVKIKHYFMRTIVGWTSLVVTHLGNIRRLKVNQIIPWDALNIVFIRTFDFVKIINQLRKEIMYALPLKSKDIEKITIFTAQDDYYVRPVHTEFIKSFLPESIVINIKKGGHAWFIYDNSELLKVLKK